MGGWRKIDSAPKDGTRILIWCPEMSSGPVLVAKGTGLEQWPWNDGYGLLHADIATHWQPLPEPPAGA